MALSRRSRRVLLAILIVPVLSVAGLELGARILDRIRGESWDADAERIAIHDMVGAIARPVHLPNERTGAPIDDEPDRPREAQLLNPYTGWDYLSTQKRLVEDLAYYRRRESVENFDLCILGGSVAEYFSTEGGRRLTDRLRADPHLRDRGIRIHNYAFGAAKQFQPLMQLCFLLGVGHRPDAVVEIDGFNEAALGWHNAKLGAHPAYPHLLFWADATSGLRTDWEILGHLSEIRTTQVAATRFGDWLLRSGLWRSSFLGHAGLARLESLDRDYHTAFVRYGEYLRGRSVDAANRGPAYATDEEGAEDAIVCCWQEGSASMHGICAERGIVFLHVLQPTLHDRGSKTPTAKEIAKGGADPAWIEGVERIYPRLREAVKRLAERGVAVLDATRLFRDCSEDIYYDVCHFGRRGNELLADAIAPALIRAADW